jgi:hypothetical protein
LKTGDVTLGTRPDFVNPCTNIVIEDKYHCCQLYGVLNYRYFYPENAYVYGITHPENIRGGRYIS